MVTGTCWAAVRCTEGKEWIHCDDIGLSFDEALRKYKETEKGIPEWAKANPVVRIVKIEIREVETI